MIHDDVHIATGAVFYGNVHIENRAFIGAGAVLAGGVRVGEKNCVGARVILIILV
ncbi:MAG: hypothetical protein QNK11_08005 [Legionella sp.]|nr:hypothetical protein [Legionella sp.]